MIGAVLDREDMRRSYGWLLSRRSGQSWAKEREGGRGGQEQQTTTDCNCQVSRQWAVQGRCHWRGDWEWGEGIPETQGEDLMCEPTGLWAHPSLSCSISCLRCIPADLSKMRLSHTWRSPQVAPPKVKCIAEGYPAIMCYTSCVLCLRPLRHPRQWAAIFGQHVFSSH